jgi:hypothetical protein
VSDPITAADWERMAREELETADVLGKAHKWRGAFTHAGLAVEFALKCRIMRVQRLNSWPDRGKFHTHDLVELAGHADLTVTLLQESAAISSIGTAWAVVKEWSIGVRYDPKPFPPRRGADMLEAVGRRGLLEWLLRR